MEGKKEVRYWRRRRREMNNEGDRKEKGFRRKKDRFKKRSGRDQKFVYYYGK